MWNNKDYILEGVAIALLLLFIGGSYLAVQNKKEEPQEVTLGAPTSQSTRNVFPFTDSLYEIGTSTAAYLRATIDELCLTADTCYTSITSGGGSGNVSTSTVPTKGHVAYWTSSGATPETLGSVATTTPTIGDGLSYSGTIGNLIGGVSGTLTATLGTDIVESELSINAPTNDYILTASSSATGGWEWVATTSPNLGFVQDSDLHDAVTLSGTPDYITLSGQDIVRGTVDIGDDTNLSCGTNCTLTGDEISVDDAFLINNGNDSTSGQLTATNFVGSSGSATSTLAGGLAIETSGLVYDFSTNRVGIGTASPSETLSVTGELLVTASTTFNGVEYLFPSADGSSGQALTTNGAGGLSWASVSGAPSGTTGQTITYNSSNTAIATSSLFIAQDQNIGIGTTTPLVVNGNAVSGTGMHIAEDSGNANLVLDGSTGGQLLMNYTGGAANTRLWRFLTGDGQFNIDVLNDNLTVKNNIFQFTDGGNWSFGTTTSIKPITFTASADSDPIMTIFNTRPDDQSGDVLELRGGDNDYLANTVYITLSDNNGTEHAWIQGAFDSADAGIAINTTAENADDFVIDESGKIGIGVTNPEEVFHLITSNGEDGMIVESPNPSVWLTDSSDANKTWAIYNQGASDNLAIVSVNDDRSSSSNQRLAISHANGYVGAAVLASATSNDLCYNTSAISGFNSLSTCSSSERYKENISDLSLGGLETVLALRPVEFDWIGDGEHDLGFIAEETEVIDPILASYHGGQIEGVKYKQLTAVLVKAIQELEARVAILEKGKIAVGGVPPEQFNDTSSSDKHFDWSWLGLLGLLGLIPSVRKYLV